MTDEKLWRYTKLSGIWARALMIVGVLIFAVGLLMQIGDTAGAWESWLLTGAASVVVTTGVFFILLRGWMQNGGLPSTRLVDATADPGTPRRPEASTGNWLAWSATLGIGLFVAGVFIMAFLIGVLGGGGMPEGVVAGVLVAWGLVTLEDVRRLVRIEQEQHRVYFAACKRPIAVGSVLVWREPGQGQPAT